MACVQDIRGICTRHISKEEFESDTRCLALFARNLSKCIEFVRTTGANLSKAEAGFSWNESGGHSRLDLREIPMVQDMFPTKRPLSWPYVRQLWMGVARDTRCLHEILILALESSKVRKSKILTFFQFARDASTNLSKGWLFSEWIWRKQPYSVPTVRFASQCTKIPWNFRQNR